MKKALLSLALLTSVTIVKAQDVKVGIKGGVSLANFSGKDVDESKLRTGVNAGVAFDFGFSDLISLQPELLYSMKGSRTEIQQANTTITNTLHYLDIPLLLKINADGPFFEFGPQIGFLLGAKNENKIGTVSVDDTNKDPYSTVDYGYVVGVGYQFSSGPSLGVRYNGGLNSLRSDDYKGPLPLIGEKTYNSAFMFQLGYLFGGR